MKRDTLETVVRTLVAGAIILGILFAWPHLAPYLPGSSKKAPPPAAAPAQESPTGKPTTPPGQTPPAEKPPAEKPAAEKPPAPAAEKPPAPVAEKPPAPVAEKPPGEKPPAPPVVKVPALVAVGAAEAPKEPIVLGSALAVSAFDLEAEIDPLGAAVRRLTLARRKTPAGRQFFKTVADRHLSDDQRAAMNLIESDSPEAAFTIPELAVKLKGVDGWSKVDLADVVWRTEPKTGGGESATLAVDVKDSAGAVLLTVRKTFTLQERQAPPEGKAAEAPQYEMGMVLEFVAAEERVEKVMYTVQGPSALPKEGRRADFRTAVFGKWAEGGNGRVEVESVAGAKIEDMAAPGALLAWLGQADKYFAVILIPMVPSPGGTFVLPDGTPNPADRLAAGVKGSTREVTEHRKKIKLPVVQLLSKETPLAVGTTVTHAYTVFAGPKDAKHLEAYYAAIGLDQLVVWTRCCISIPGLQHISRLLLWVVDQFESLVGNYGLAIIMLVLLLRACLLPVSKWSAKSMAEMQKMAPKMQEIKEKYSGDQKRMQEEMAKIGGLKAFGGCLPMFVQMPIWIGLYGALQAAIQLRHSAMLPASWIPEWSVFLQDLAAPDALIAWETPWYIPGQDIPLLGWVIGSIQGMLGGGLTSFNILPLLMGVVMFLQQKLTVTTAAGPQAEQQKKMMMFMMLFFAVILYSAPSGLCLYIATSMGLGLVENKFFRRKWIEAAKAKESGEAPTPKAAKPKDVREKSLVSGRDKSIGERAEAWIKQRIGQAKAKPGGKKGRKRRK